MFEVVKLFNCSGFVIPLPANITYFLVLGIICKAQSFFWKMSSKDSAVAVAVYDVQKDKYDCFIVSSETPGAIPNIIVKYLRNNNMFDDDYDDKKTLGFYHNIFISDVSIFYKVKCLI